MKSKQQIEELGKIYQESTPNQLYADYLGFVKGYGQAQKDAGELLAECKLQLEYLNDKFGETGTTNILLGKLTL